MEQTKAILRELFFFAKYFKENVFSMMLYNSILMRELTKRSCFVFPYNIITTGNKELFLFILFYFFLGYDKM